jgi:hypothetical protein
MPGRKPRPSFDGGRIAIRGFLVQTLAALSQAFKTDAVAGEPTWVSMETEPLVAGSDKVDILWGYDDGTYVAEQVKSTGNSFTTADAKAWAQELVTWRPAQRATRYRLTLAGGGAGSIKAEELPDRFEVNPLTENVEHLQIHAAHYLEKFLKAARLPTGDGDYRMDRISSLEGKVLAGALVGRQWTPDTLYREVTTLIPSNVGTFQTLRVFVSAPEDREKERQVVDEVVAYINSTFGEQLRIALKVVDGSDMPNIPPGPVPSQYTRGTSRLYDFYIGIVESQFGTLDNRSGRGSRECFEAALGLWGTAGAHWCGVYFGVPDPSRWSPEQSAAFVEVTEVRRQAHSLSVDATYRGLRGDAEAFYQVLLARLTNAIGTISPPVDSADQPAAKRQRYVLPTIPPEYTDWVKTTYGDVRLLGLDAQQGQDVRLRHVYVPAMTSGGIFRKPNQPLLSILNKRSLYVPGAPGSGKSTLCRWVAWLVCEGEMPKFVIPPPPRLREDFPDLLRGKMPLLIELREFAPALPRDGRQRTLTAAQFEDALMWWVERKQLPGVTRDLVVAHLKAGTLLLMLDGVDEIPLSDGDDGQASEPRSMFLSGLADAGSGWIRTGNRLLLTSRPYGLTVAQTNQLRFETADIVELTNEVQSLLVRRWFHRLCDSQIQGEALAGAMLQAIAARDDIKPLAGNPMLLTAMCIVYRHTEGGLPHDRFEVYHRIVESVLRNKFPDSATAIAPIRKRLAVVAHGMHTGDGLGDGGGSDNRDAPEPIIRFDQIDRLIKLYQGNLRTVDEQYKGVVAAREQLINETGLLLPRGDETAGFYHVTIQDFLAAQQLYDLADGSLRPYFLSRSVRPEWRSTLAFLLGWHIARHDDAEKTWALVGELIGDLPSEASQLSKHIGLGVVLGECLQILLTRKFRIEDLIGRYKTFCVNVIEHCSDPAQYNDQIRERYQLAIALGYLGDPRLVDKTALPIKPQESFKELRVHLVSGSRQSSYSFVRAKFLPGEVQAPWAVRFLDDQGHEIRHFVWDSLTWQEAREGPVQWGGKGRYALLNHASGDGPEASKARTRRIEWAEGNIPEIGARLRAQDEAARQHGGSVCAALYLLKYSVEPFGRARLTLNTGMPALKGEEGALDLSFDGSAFTWKGDVLFKLAGFQAGGHDGTLEVLAGSRVTRSGIVTKTSFNGQTHGLSWKRTYWLHPEGCFAALEEFTPTEEGYFSSANLPQIPSIWEGELSIVATPTWTKPWWTLKGGSSVAAVHLFHHVPLATGYGNNPFSSNSEGGAYDPSLQPAGDGRVALDWPFDTGNLGFLFAARPGLSREVMFKGDAAKPEMLPWRANIDWFSRQYLVGVGSTEEEASRGLQQLLCAAGGWIDRPYKKEEIQALIVKQFLGLPRSDSLVPQFEALPHAIRGDRAAAMRVLEQGDSIDKLVEIQMNQVRANARTNPGQWSGYVKNDQGEIIGQGLMDNPAYSAVALPLYLRIQEHFGLDHRVKESREALVRWADDTLRLFGGEERDPEKFRAGYRSPSQGASRVVMLVPLMLRAYRETKDEKYAKLAVMIFDDIMVMVESNPKGYWDTAYFEPIEPRLFDSVYNCVTFGRGLTDFWAEGELNLIGQERASRLTASQARLLVYDAQLLDSFEMDSATAVAAHNHVGHPLLPEPGRPPADRRFRFLQGPRR